MNKIGFQNFRRFQNFKPLKFQGITFLVGRNNSGKSTLVKALLLIDNYFKSGATKVFSFGNNVLEDANIVTYGRAKYSKSEENLIKFTQDFNNYSVEIILGGDDDKSFADVSTLMITEVHNNFTFLFDFKSNSNVYFGI